MATTTIAGNRSARDAILARVRKALGKTGEDAGARRDAEGYVALHARGPYPVGQGNVVERFLERAIHMESTVERIASREAVPHAVARYLKALELPDAIAEQKTLSGVCWPEFADLDWRGAGLSIEPRPTQGHDRLGVTGCLCAIAETGTLVLIPGAQMPTATALLPDTHVVVLRAGDVVATMEDAFARVRGAKSRLPRAINLISGPSRTGDIEQTIVLGAHGPYRVHILLLDASAKA
jgi:L-lactate dehydrogenase complex protein LldG